MEILETPTIVAEAWVGPGQSAMGATLRPRLATPEEAAELAAESASIAEAASQSYLE